MSHLFFDTDLFILVAGAGLLEEAADAVGFSLDDARRLQPLPFMLKGSRLKSKFTRGVRERAAAWCELVRPIEEAPDAHLQERLNSIAGLDVGEAFLFASAAITGGSVVATGDKRACRALAAADLGTSSELLHGKVLCFETVLTALLVETEFKTIARSFSPLREASQTLRVLLPQSERTPEPSFRDGLRSFEREIVETLGDFSRRPQE